MPIYVHFCQVWVVSFSQDFFHSWAILWGGKQVLSWALNSVPPWEWENGEVDQAQVGVLAVAVDGWAMVVLGREMAGSSPLAI